MAGLFPRMAESLEQLDLLLLTVAKTRKIQADGVRFQGMRYIDPTLAAYVGESVVLRYDPRDVAEVRLFHQGKFLCRAICPELAGEPSRCAISNRLAISGGASCARPCAIGRKTVEALLDLRRGPPAEATEPRAKPHHRRPNRVPALKRYRNE